MMSDPENSYKPNLITESTKSAKIPFVEVFFANLMVKY